MDLHGQRVVVLGGIDHLVFTAGEPLALMGLATLDPDRARESFSRCGPR